MTVQVEDDLVETIRRTAESAGRSPDSVVNETLRLHFSVTRAVATQRESSTFYEPDAPEVEQARARFGRYIGAIHSGNRKGADNTQIDRDLARAYADNHEAEGE